MAGLVRECEHLQASPAARLRAARLSGGRSPEWVGPHFGRTHPDFATALRRDLLTRCYLGDYHADVHDGERLSRRVARGEEQILFWGEPAHVARLAELASSGAAPSDLATLPLGTHTVLPGEVLYGPGHVEVARTGSTHRGTDTAARAIVWDLGRVLSGDSPIPRAHTISCVPRNRRSAPRIPGGTAIHRIHTRTVGSSHWGVAPFYVMARGYLELLDYRELTLEDQAVPRGFAELTTVHVADPGTASLITALCRLNGFDPPIRAGSASPIPTGPRAASRAAGCDAHGPRVTHLRHDHVTQDLATGIAYQGEACSAVLLDLEDERSPAVETTLVANGFVLSYLSPPKLLAATEDTAARRIPLRGGFVRIRTTAPLAQPYYLDGGPLDERERELVERYRCLVASWCDEGGRE